MCTAVSLNSRCHCFGRNLDLEYHYREAVTIIPRNHPLVFRHSPTMDTHYAMIGIATVEQGYPLYYDATNENLAETVSKCIDGGYTVIIYKKEN